MPLRAETLGDKAGWSGILRVLIRGFPTEKQSARRVWDIRNSVISVVSVVNKTVDLPVLPSDDSSGTRVDSTEKCVVCLKGFEDDGSNRKICVVRIRKAPPSAGLLSDL